MKTEINHLRIFVPIALMTMSMLSPLMPVYGRPQGYTLVYSPPRAYYVDWMDVKAVYLKEEGDRLYFYVEYYGAIPSSKDYYRAITISMDTDRNPLTGSVSNELGLDYDISFSLSGDNSDFFAGLSKYDNSSNSWKGIKHLEQNMRLAPELNYMEIWVDKQNIGYISNGIDFVVWLHSEIKAIREDRALTYVIGSSKKGIMVDGKPDDWGTINPLLTFPSRSVNPPEFEVSSFYVANDDENLYFRFDTRGKLTTSLNEGELNRHFDIYLDTDNNDSTGYEEYSGAEFRAIAAFHASPSKSTYVDYYKYTGTGRDWSWEKIGGSLNSSDFNNVFEFKIPLSLLRLNAGQRVNIFIRECYWGFDRKIPRSGHLTYPARASKPEIYADFSSLTRYWLKLTKINAYSSITIYMGFASNTTNLFNGVTVGEAPQLSNIYGEYDNGKNVFLYYTNFTNLNGWIVNLSKGSYSVKNGLSISFNGPGYVVTNSTYGPGTAFAAGIISIGDADNVGYFDINEPVNDGQGWAGAFIRLACGNTYPDQWNASGEANGCGSPYGYFVNREGIPGTYLVEILNRTSSIQFLNGNFSRTINTNYPRYTAHVGFSGVYSSISVQWAFVMNMPPNGVMPAFNVSEHVYPSGSDSNVKVPSGIIYYVPIQITNNQPIPTPDEYQQLILVNSSNYLKYEAPNLENIEFFYANGTVIPSWLESINMRHCFISVFSQYGVPTGEGWYRKGTTATISISPTLIDKDFFSYYVFEGWKAGDTIVSTSPTYSFVVDKPISLVASWRIEPKITSILIILMPILIVMLAAITLTRRRKPSPPPPPPLEEGVEKEIKKYEEYLDRLEQLRKEGKISERVYERLKQEYEKKLEELVDKLKK